MEGKFEGERNRGRFVEQMIPDAGLSSFTELKRLAGIWEEWIAYYIKNRKVEKRTKKNYEVWTLYGRQAFFFVKIHLSLVTVRATYYKNTWLYIFTSNYFIIDINSNVQFNFIR